MNMNQYQRHSEIGNYTVFEAMREGIKRLNIDQDISCGLVSVRMRTFYEHGVVCEGCGRVGQFFAVERPLNSTDHRQWHLNLYDAEGMLMTHDHVIPRSKGGKDNTDNTQTMCYECNQRKADRMPHEGLGPVRAPKQPRVTIKDAAAQVAKEVAERNAAWAGIGVSDVCDVWNRMNKILGKSQADAPVVSD
ncbi:putative HNH endonuclease [Delftia phage PhiW-14]|uniref:Putative HNH endonuclease n=1 Tax=Delftia phage PhiW-14 TaxID=665032 RepID=C9DGB3_BPW14|nr:HNH endonuclease [Delftia phage PhiW-14]ACV50164.1 putative HNH endonuclease [Delftia phage PhiW-14]